MISDDMHNQYRQDNLEENLIQEVQSLKLDQDPG
jgi:hypothetical protein